MVKNRGIIMWDDIQYVLGKRIECEGFVQSTKCVSCINNKFCWHEYHNFEDDKMGDYKCDRRMDCVIVKYYNDKFRCVDNPSICWWILEGVKVNKIDV